MLVSLRPRTSCLAVEIVFSPSLVAFLILHAVQLGIWSNQPRFLISYIQEIKYELLLHPSTRLSIDQKQFQTICRISVGQI
ncbi:hypothetical protein M752DRAFT_136740 [Aspergillus phoenicis ATCC 13157]|uniref:Uncharacterized protein n=1 Tax=Aspergillus phoenicis ATCC 13157 TaxID=1353007 RepID=A0A370PPY6_ASPPH|nr:hypothetical protein M752DRAFT_136740 [Aspergillus phoenicis ATCC 13157]